MYSFRSPHSQIWLGLQLRIRDWTINNFMPFVLYTINNGVYRVARPNPRLWQKHVSKKYKVRY